MPADYWFVELSGMPMGIGNDMLLHMTDNKRRGMLFGMTPRGFWPMWKLWDSFGITDSEMFGFWEADPVISTDHEEVYVTTYIKQGKVLVVIGNWLDKPVEVRLNIDWERLGLDPLSVSYTAPHIDDYQTEKTYKAGEPFPVPAKGDLLLLISKRE